MIQCVPFYVGIWLRGMHLHVVLSHVIGYLGISTLSEKDEKTASLHNIGLKATVLNSQSRLQNSPLFNGLSVEEAREVCNKHLQVCVLFNSRHNQPAYNTNYTLLGRLLSSC